MYVVGGGGGGGVAASVLADLVVKTRLREFLYKINELTPSGVVLVLEG